MDGCSLQDAFPDSGGLQTDCMNRGAAEESRRQERRKKRQCRATDSDRPVSHMDAVLPMNKATGLTEHSPATGQYPYEPFVGQEGSMTDFSVIQKNVKEIEQDQQGSLPAYFGASPNDTVSPVLQTPSTQKSRPQQQTEGFVSDPAPFVNVIGENSGYRLYPDFAKSFAATGAQKAAGLGTYKGPSPTYSESNYITPTSMSPSDVLPYPNVDMFWKKQGGQSGQQGQPTAGQSAFFRSLQAPGGQPTGDSIYAHTTAPPEPSGRRELGEKLDRIFARLQDLEQIKSENANTEVLMFIMTGLGIIFLMDLSTRLALRRK